jgi:hypothetical protein
VPPTIPRLLTSLISGPMEAYTGMHIVLVGRLRERVLLWCVLSPLQLIRRHRFIFLASLLDCVDLCCIRSPTLSVRHDLTTSEALRVHTYRSNYTNRAQQRQMYVPYPRPSCSYLICLPRSLQNPNSVYATCICRDFVLLLPILPKLYLLLSCRNR